VGAVFENRKYWIGLEVQERVHSHGKLDEPGINYGGRGETLTAATSPNERSEIVTVTGSLLLIQRTSLLQQCCKLILFVPNSS